MATVEPEEEGPKLNQDEFVNMFGGADAIPKAHEMDEYCDHCDGGDEHECSEDCAEAHEGNNPILAAFLANCDAAEHIAFEHLENDPYHRALIHIEVAKLHQAMLLD